MDRWKVNHSATKSVPYTHRVSVAACVVVVGLDGFDSIVDWVGF